MSMVSHLHHLVAYLASGDNYSGPIPSHLYRSNQPIMTPQNEVEGPR